MVLMPPNDSRWCWMPTVNTVDAEPATTIWCQITLDTTGWLCWGWSLPLLFVVCYCLEFFKANGSLVFIVLSFEMTTLPTLLRIRIWTRFTGTSEPMLPNKEITGRFTGPPKWVWMKGWYTRRNPPGLTREVYRDWKPVISLCRPAICSNSGLLIGPSIGLWLGQVTAVMATFQWEDKRDRVVWQLSCLGENDNAETKESGKDTIFIIVNLGLGRLEMLILSPDTSITDLD